MRIFKPVVVFNFSVVLLTAFTFSSCNTNKDDELEVPATYTFMRDGNSTVAYEGQIARQDMLELMSAYLETSNTVGVAALDADVLNNMFRNENEPFSGVTFSQNLRSKCFAPDAPMFDQFLLDIALTGLSTGTASDGSAGVLVTGSPDQNEGYRVNANGVELNQVFVAGLMGAVFFYQATDVYLTEERMGEVGNTDLVDTKNYTNMERYFDEAFGYFGIPTDFPSAASLSNARFWGKFCNVRNEGLYPNINVEMGLNFRTARAAIAAKQYDVRDEFMRNILDKWAV
ncbi:MAG: DUF4856 domain-containing protein [Flavobacteriales bacterium]|nr:DUF4856 domain-containing protein [Flavobacteriales bacterium]